jgi:hypothetical protein
MFVVCGVMGGIMVVCGAVCITSRRLIYGSQKPAHHNIHKIGRPATKSSDEQKVK